MAREGGMDGTACGCIFPSFPARHGPKKAATQHQRFLFCLPCIVPCDSPMIRGGRMNILWSIHVHALAKKTV